MPISVDELDAAAEEQWDSFVVARTDRFAYHSLRFRDFLCALLPDGSARYLVARRDGEIVGVLPAFVDRSDLGAVVTSLPFHCSNGGALTDDDESAEALIAAFVELADEEQAVASSLVTVPFGPSEETHRRWFPHRFAEDRLGQWTGLPSTPDELWTVLHGKTRNAVRKGERSGVLVRRASCVDDWDRLEALHGENMARLGAAPKSRRTIDLLGSVFGDAADLWVAEHEDRIVAAVLCVSAAGVAEYIIPAFDESRRDLQALSLTVWTALSESTGSGARLFNWGGTRPGQIGVHRFKSRWAGSEAPYTVLTSVHDDTILDRTIEQLSTAWPQSFVVPFSALKS